MPSHAEFSARYTEKSAMPLPTTVIAVFSSFHPLHLEVAYVLVHQILRIMVTSFGATLIFRLIGWHKTGDLKIEDGQNRDK